MHLGKSHSHDKGVIGMKKKRSAKWNIARKMPPLRHSFPGQDFDIQKSEAAKWLIRQSDIMQLIFESVKNMEITYDPKTGMWKGVDHNN
jgi:hypothetical protein